MIPLLHPVQLTVIRFKQYENDCIVVQCIVLECFISESTGKSKNVFLSHFIFRGSNLNIIWGQCILESIDTNQ